MTTKFFYKPTADALSDDKVYVADLLNQIPVLHPGGEATGLCTPICK